MISDRKGILKSINPKLFAFDLDNTLILDSKLSEENARALNAAADAGIELVVNTGRGLTGIYDDVKSIRGIKYAITSNGACIYNLRSGEVIRRFTLSPGSVQKLMETGHSFNVTYEIFVEGHAYVSQEYYDDPARFGMPPKLVGYIQNTRQAVPDLDEFIKQNASKIENFAYVVKDEFVHEAVRCEALKQCDDIFITGSDVQWVEVMDHESGKGKGMGHLCRYLNIDIGDTVAFGDSDNDIEMLEYAGLGICMENGTQNCKAAADAICKSCVEDGVADAIYELIK